MTNTRKKQLAIGTVGAAVIVSASVIIGALTSSSSSVSVPSGIATDCSADVSASLNAYVASLPHSTTITSPSSACFLVNEGVLISNGVSLNGGTFKDASTAKPTGNCGYCGFHPIIKIKDTSNVTLENIHVVGANTSGMYHSSLVGEAGIDVLSSDHVTITHVTTADTFGDGITLWANLPKVKTPTTNTTVSYVTVTAAGRQGISPADVSHATFDHVTIDHTGEGNAWDFESDIKGIGTGNMSVTHSSWVGGTNIIDFLTGPVTFTDDTGQGHISLGSLNSQQPVTFTRGSYLLPANDPGTPPAGITQDGGVLTFTDVKFGRVKVNKPTTGPAWYVSGNGTLNLVRSPIPGPQGSVTQGSTVNITQ